MLQVQDKSYEMHISLHEYLFISLKNNQKDGQMAKYVD
jgi:hypothetical protein